MMSGGGGRTVCALLVKKGASTEAFKSTLLCQSLLNKIYASYGVCVCVEKSNNANNNGGWRPQIVVVVVNQWWWETLLNVGWKNVCFYSPRNREKSSIKNCCCCRSNTDGDSRDDTRWRRDLPQRLTNLRTRAIHTQSKQGECLVKDAQKGAHPIEKTGEISQSQERWQISHPLFSLHPSHSDLSLFIYAVECTYKQDYRHRCKDQG